MKKMSKSVKKLTNFHNQEQIQEYSELEEMKSISNLRKYTVIAVNDEIYTEEV